VSECLVKFLLGSSSYSFNKWLVSRKYHRIGLHKSALEAHLDADIMLFGQSICIFYCSKLCTVCFWNEWDNYVKIRVYSLTFLCIIFILKRLLIFNTETTRCSWSDVFNTILLADPEIWKGWGAEDNVSAPVVVYHKCTYWTIWTIPVLDGKKRKKTESNRVGDRHCLWNWLTKFASITCASVSELRLFFWLSATTLHLRHLFDMFAFIFQLLAHTTRRLSTAVGLQNFSPAHFAPVHNCTPSDSACMYSKRLVYYLLTSLIYILCAFAASRWCVLPCCVFIWWCVQSFVWFLRATFSVTVVCPRNKKSAEC